MSAPAAGVDIALVSRVFEAMLCQHDKPILYHDRSVGQDVALSHDETASALGLLPAFLLAGEAVWSQTTGNGFGLDIVEDKDSIFGYAVRAVRGGSLSAVMLSMLDVLLRIDTGDATIYANELNRSWDLPQVPVVSNIKAAGPAAGATP